MMFSYAVQFMDCVNKDVNTKEFYDFMNHLMKSKGTCCYAPSKRYCEIGLRLKREYAESLKHV